MPNRRICDEIICLQIRHTCDEFVNSSYFRRFEDYKREGSALSLAFKHEEAQQQHQLQPWQLRQEE